MKRTDYAAVGETLYSAVLPNGMPIFVMPKPGYRKVFAMCAANYGGVDRRFSLDGRETNTPAGVAHYLEHKMFDMPDGDNALSLLNANGADPNASTGDDTTCYYFQCTERFEENLRLLLHFVSTPYFTEETVQKERGIIAQEIRMGEDEPGLILFYNFLHQLYDHHPIRDRVAGTVESIQAITPEMLYACYRAFYAPGNMCLCVMGDVSPERVRQIAEEELGGENRPVPKPDYGEAESLLPVEAFHREEASVSAPQFMIGSKLAVAPKGEAALRQRLVSQLALRLLVGSSSPFYTKLYAEGLLNRDFDYEAYFSSGTGTLIIEGESEEPEAVFAALREEAARVAAEGFDAERFERAKRASLGARLRGLEDFGSVCMSLLTGVFEGYCSFDAIALLGGVTKRECEDFVREALSDERLVLSIIEPKKD